MQLWLRQHTMSSSPVARLLPPSSYSEVSREHQHLSLPLSWAFSSSALVWFFSSCRNQPRMYQTRLSSPAIWIKCEQSQNRHNQRPNPKQMPFGEQLPLSDDSRLPERRESWTKQRGCTKRNNRTWSLSVRTSTSSGMAFAGAEQHTEAIVYGLAETQHPFQTLRQLIHLSRIHRLECRNSLLSPTLMLMKSRGGRTPGTHCLSSKEQNR